MSSDRVLVDNDVVFKLCAYALHRVLIQADAFSPAFMLPAAGFVLRDLGRRSGRVRDRDAVAAALEEAIAAVQVVRPSDAALSLAAELEDAANTLSLDLDPGESQLLAVMLVDGARLLLTGDKRAVVAMEALARDDARGRVASLEQVFIFLLGMQDVPDLRAAVCAEPGVDKAMTACFGCHSDTATHASVQSGLESYLGALRRAAPTVLSGQL